MARLRTCMLQDACIGGRLPSEPLRGVAPGRSRCLGHGGGMAKHLRFRRTRRLAATAVQGTGKMHVHARTRHLYAGQAWGRGRYPNSDSTHGARDLRRLGAGPGIDARAAGAPARAPVHIRRGVRCL